MFEAHGLPKAGQESRQILPARKRMCAMICAMTATKSERLAKIVLASCILPE
jgi:hypothetical protein